MLDLNNKNRVNMDKLNLRGDITELGIVNITEHILREYEKGFDALMREHNSIERKGSRKSFTILSAINDLGSRFEDVDVCYNGSYCTSDVIMFCIERKRYMAILSLNTIREFKFNERSIVNTYMEQLKNGKLIVNDTKDLGREKPSGCITYVRYTLGKIYEARIPAHKFACILGENGKDNRQFLINTCFTEDIILVANHIHASKCKNYYIDRHLNRLSNLEITLHQANRTFNKSDIPVNSNTIDLNTFLYWTNLENEYNNGRFCMTPDGNWWLDGRLLLKPNMIPKICL